MMRKLRNLFAEVTMTAVAVVTLTLAGFGFQEASEPRMVWSGSRRERHLIDCRVCRDTMLPVEEQLRSCPELVELQRQLLDRSCPNAEGRPAPAVAGLRPAHDPGAE